MVQLTSSASWMHRLVSVYQKVGIFESSYSHLWPRILLRNREGCSFPCFWWVSLLAQIEFCMIMWLIDDSSYVNGQNIAVDGGLSASHPVVPGRWAWLRYSLYYYFRISTFDSYAFSWKLETRQMLYEIWHIKAVDLFLMLEVNWFWLWFSSLIITWFSRCIKQFYRPFLTRLRQ